MNILKQPFGLVICALISFGCAEELEPVTVQPVLPAVEDGADSSAVPAEVQTPTTQPVATDSPDPGSSLQHAETVVGTDRVDWAQRARTLRWDKRRVALEELRKEGDEALRAVLDMITEFAACRTCKADVRVLSVEILDELDDERSLAPLLDMMEEQNGTLVYTIGEALKDYGTEAEGGLSARLVDPSDNVRFACALALQKIGAGLELRPGTVAALTDALADRDTRVAQVAMRILAAQGAGASDAIAARIGALLQPGARDRAKEAALITLSGLGAKAEGFENEILALLEDETPGVRFEAAVLALSLKQVEPAAAVFEAFLRGDEAFWRREAATVFELPESFAGLAAGRRTELLAALDSAIASETDDDARAAITSARRAFAEEQ